MQNPLRGHAAVATLGKCNTRGLDFAVSSQMPFLTLVEWTPLALHSTRSCELAIALDVLHGHYDRVVLEQLRPHFADIIATPAGLMATMKSLEPAAQLLLVEAIGTQLPRILQKSTYLADLLATLAAIEVKEAILQTLGAAGLRTLVSTATDLANVLR
jgi:hypothetical protein